MSDAMLEKIFACKPLTNVGYLPALKRKISVLHLKRVKIIGWRVKVEDRQEWSRIVEQTKIHPGLQSQ
jgi:hypothetical protein